MSGALVSMEFGQLEDLLRPAIEQDAVVNTLHRLLCDTVASDGGATMADLGIQVPEVDADIVNMQSEVDAILQRLCECRKAVPAAVSGAMQQQLAALRPVCDPLPIDGPTTVPEAADGSDAAAREAAAGAEVQRLHEAMVAAFSKLPGLRARLEAAEERLARNLAAVEGELRRSSPTTVERVMTNRTNLQGSGGGSEPRPTSGNADTTKQRLARALGA